ncbi:MAG: YceI family protein [Gemmatimonadota bacterium]
MSTLQIDTAHSNVEFAVKHLMIATVRGRFARLSGHVDFNEAFPAASTVAVTIDTASLDTREDKRDAHLRSADFFEVEKYPEITFRSSRIEGNVAGSFKLVGALTIKGNTRPVTLEVTSEGQATDPWGNLKSGYSAKGKIKRSEFGLSWNQVLEAGGVLVGDEISISIELELLHPAEAALAAGTQASGGLAS